MRFYPLTIAATQPLTAQAIAVEFAVPAEWRARFNFQHGQYVTLRAMVDGEALQRSYSITCAPDEAKLAIAIKRIEGGRMSSYAHANFRAGVTVEVAAPAGEFTLPLQPQRSRAYLCIAAGSGITPVISIIKTVLRGEPLSRVTLLFGNQRTSTMMFRDELGALKNAYLDRLQWLNVMTREQQDAAILNGRIDNRKGAQLNRALIRIRAYDEFFLCGPQAMVSEVARGLRSEGIAESHIHYELFHASAQDARAVVEKHHARAARFGGTSAQVRVRLAGRETSFEVARDGANILDEARAAGLEAPFSCKGGVCATCKARLIEGEVEMDINHALTDAEVAAGYVLTCQAHPVTERVVIDYDAV